MQQNQKNGGGGGGGGGGSGEDIQTLILIHPMSDSTRKRATDRIDESALFASP